MQTRDHPPRQSWKKPRFTIKSTLVLTLIIGLAFGWLVDRRRVEVRFGELLQLEKERSSGAETRLSRLSTWYAGNHTLDDVPRELREIIAETSDRVVDPKTGFRLFCVRDAGMTLAFLGLQGDSFRVRGGPLRFEFVAEDLSGDEPRVIYRHVGPEDGAKRNTDGILTFSKARTLFKPHPVNAALREPSDELYRFSFSQGSFRPIIVPTKEVWPDWIYTAEGAGSRIYGQASGLQETVFPASEAVTLFSQELVAKDGRQARVRLTVTCEEAISRE